MAADLRQFFSALLQKLANKAVLTVNQVVEGAVEDKAALFEHQECGIGICFSLW
jgi:hypothetical protein